MYRTTENHRPGLQMLKSPPKARANSFVFGPKIAAVLYRPFRALLFVQSCAPGFHPGLICVAPLGLAFCSCCFVSPFQGSLWRTAFTQGFVSLRPGLESVAPSGLFQQPQRPLFKAWRKLVTVPYLRHGGNW